MPYVEYFQLHLKLNKIHEKNILTEQFGQYWHSYFFGTGHRLMYLGTTRHKRKTILKQHVGTPLHRP